MRFHIQMAVLSVVGYSTLLAQDFETAVNPGSDDVYIRVVDVGPGLCTVTSIPGPYFIIYDAGHWNGDNCLTAVREIVGEHEIDLMVISHSDGDHLGEAREILDEYPVYHVYRTGFPRMDTRAWREFNEAVGEQTLGGTSVTNLQTITLVPGEAIEFGDATVTFMSGEGIWSGDPGAATLSASERRNVISIVMKLEYHDNAILYGGDTVGRKINGPDDQCDYAEEDMTEFHDAGDINLQAGIIIAPHHGAANANSTCFIQRVDPQFVIFSAGHQHDHPRSTTAQRYLDLGVDPANIFRTDFGDDEGGAEWDGGRETDCTDPSGDNDIEIVLPMTGSVRVAYRWGPVAC